MKTFLQLSQTEKVTDERLTFGWVHLKSDKKKPTVATFQADENEGIIRIMAECVEVYLNHLEAALPVCI